MEQNTLQKYNIRFYNTVHAIPGFPRKVDKTIDSVSNALNEFLYAWSDPGEITESLLPDIHAVLNQDVPEEETDSETVRVKLRHDSTKLYSLITDSVLVAPALVLPTSDFKKIVESWRSFLLTPPLNGAKV